MDGRLPRTVVLELDWDNEKRKWNLLYHIGLGAEGEIRPSGYLKLPLFGSEREF